MHRFQIEECRFIWGRTEGVYHELECAKMIRKYIVQTTQNCSKAVFRGTCVVDLCRVLWGGF